MIWNGRLLTLNGTVQANRYSVLTGQIVGRVIDIARDTVISLSE